MARNYLCISIPEELQKFKKDISLYDMPNDSSPRRNDFGVKLIKNESGILVGTAYYSDTGELIKKIYYKGSSVSSIEHYRNNKLYAQEKFDTGKIIRKILYSQHGKPSSEIKYQYNRSNQIVCIQKVVGNQRYSVEYGYDELKRVNSRAVKVNNKVINEQHYKYDILDRIVEYKDLNQRINVHKVNQNNELVSYTITDVIGNKIIVNNKFVCSDYVGTEIELNGHKSTIEDKSYVNNIMLKKPYTTEDDLDFALSNLIEVPNLRPQDNFISRSERYINSDEIANYIIMSKKDKECAPPISADKIKLLKL